MACLLDGCSLVARVLFSEESLDLEDMSVSGGKELAGTELSTTWVAVVSEDSSVSRPACGVTSQRSLLFSVKSWTSASSPSSDAAWLWHQRASACHCLSRF